ncbi:MAG TPA: mechanosensitive ion channel domain-containing protein [Flavobacterium sp.]|nr:mechanosensitive ion channel domain-containing protein [Flavobacterium sp.]
MDSQKIQEDLGRMEQSIELIISKFIAFVPTLLLSLMLFFIGLFLIRIALKIIKNRFEARNISLSVRSFVISVIRFILYALLILMVANNLGVQTTAILGALSGLILAIGLALQGSLSNFAGGILILLFRPFEVGDYIENNSGTEGTVEKIDLLYTTLTNSQGIKIFSPNGALANSVISNFTKVTTRRIEFQLGISYSDNIKEVKEAIEKRFAQDNRILQQPKPDVFVKELASNSVILTIRVWATKADFGTLNFELQDIVKSAVYDNGFTNPFVAPIRVINENREESE